MFGVDVGIMTLVVIWNFIVTAPPLSAADVVAKDDKRSGLFTAVFGRGGGKG